MKLAIIKKVNFQILQLRNQANAENKKVCCKFNLNCFSKLERINKIPIKIVINEAPIKL